MKETIETKETLEMLENGISQESGAYAEVVNYSADYSGTTDLGDSDPSQGESGEYVEPTNPDAGLSNTTTNSGGGTTVFPEVIYVTDVIPNVAALSMVVGDTGNVSADVCPTNATNQSVYWSSDDESVVAVTSNGSLVAVGEGITTLTATAADGGGAYATVDITVSYVAVTSISLSPINNNMHVMDIEQVVFTYSPEDATNPNFIWSSSDESVAIVDQNGVITALSPGNVTITVAAQDGGGATASYDIFVSAYVEEILVEPSQVSVEIGKNVAFSATVLPEEATNKSVNWSSEDSNIVSMGSSGIAWGCKVGTTTITATATDGSGVVGRATMTVLPVRVESITVSPSTKTITVGDTVRFTAEIYPSTAANKDVVWSSEDSNIVSMGSSGTAWGCKSGTTTVKATAADGSGVVGTATITVLPVGVESITVSPSSATINVGETVTLTAEVYPSTAADKNVVWSSSDSDIASVNTDTGEVFAHSDGEVIITATSVDGDNTDTCTITVDSREKVTIKKDNHSFYVEFADGKIWKNIGIDLSNRQENYNQLDPPDMWYEYYDYLIEEEQRYFDNIYVEEDGVNVNNVYTVKQIAYLYLLDPLGIEYYMRNHACADKDIMSGEFLSYKDEVYEAIFGNSERSSGRFYFTIVDGTVQYGRYVGCNRRDIYSNAEVLFGSHTIFNWSSFWRSIGEAIFENLPVISQIILGVEIYQALFYSGSIVSAMSGVASEFLEKYAEETSKTSDTILKKMLGWPNTIFECFTALTGALVGAFELNNLKDMDIYSKIQKQNYRTVFDSYGTELPIKEIIDKCTNA